MKPDYREELNQEQREEDEADRLQVEADFKDFINVGLPLMMFIVIFLVFLFTELFPYLNK